MFIELHIIQNFAPSNLNRDDNNAPKDAMFGGYRRARISSQCIKRSARKYMEEHQLVELELLGLRTKRILDRIVEELVKRGRNEEKAKAITVISLGGMGLELTDDDQTQYLLYLASDGVNAFADACEQVWDQLLPLIDANSDEKEKDSKKRKKAAINKVKEIIGTSGIKQLESLLDGKKAIDLALFGRMLADLATKNIDAACQVAHAISTNEVNMEMDFYTAVDDLRPADNPGAGMMGIVEFNSSCFYRYSVIHWEQLLNNLDGDIELARKAVDAYITATIRAIPTGKQNSMAALNPPVYVRAMVRDKGEPWNLANAFMDPVRPSRNNRDDGDLGKRSIDKLESYLKQLKKIYGDTGEADWNCNLYNQNSPSLEGITQKVLEGLS